MTRFFDSLKALAVYAAILIMVVALFPFAMIAFAIDGWFWRRRVER